MVPYCVDPEHGIGHGPKVCANCINKPGGLYDQWNKEVPPEKDGSFRIPGLNQWIKNQIGKK